MRVLLIGSGGRENAIAWSVYASPLLEKLYCIPGNPGIKEFAVCIDVNIKNYEKIYDIIQKYEIDIVVIGPESPLVDGLTDFLEKKQVKVFGPSSYAAQLEGSKVFARLFCERHSIPQPDFKFYSNPEIAINDLKSSNSKNGYVIKADGLASGKGVLVTEKIEEAISFVDDLYNKEIFGHSGKQFLIEEKVFGTEASIFTLIDGKNYVFLSTAQDYKRVFENNLGPNTGGMGAISPSPLVDEKILEKIENEIIIPVINGMDQEGKPFKGVLYTGVMLTDNGPKVIEFNVRLGDPEAQVILPRLKSDFLTAILATIDGGLKHLNLRWHEEIALNVVLTSSGYPGNFIKGKRITGLNNISNNSLIFHSGTKSDKLGNLLTNSGRVLSLTSLAKNIDEARKKVYGDIKKIKFDKAFYRKDIGL